MKNTLLRLIALISLMTSSASYADDTLTSPWESIYKDRYDYSMQVPKGHYFNTWFWREDSAATHEFEVTTGDGCSSKTPCVALIAQAFPANDAYTNAEMYNNSCVTNADNGGNDSQKLATLKKSAWGKPLYHHIKSICDIPYPYKSKGSYLALFDLTSSWVSHAPSHLDANPLAFTPQDIEAPWKAIRDITFNNPYKASHETAIRIITKIKAETKNQGGSRGWGLWNTSLDPKFLQLAWFMEYSLPEAYLHAKGKKEKPNRSVVMQTIGRSLQGDELKICSTNLDPDQYNIYQWQTYTVEWRNNVVRYFVNGKKFADHRVVLDKHMAFHNWVDNRNYTAPEAEFSNFPLTKDKINYINSFLVERAETSSLKKLSGTATDQCITLRNDSLLIDILKKLEKVYL